MLHTFLHPVTYRLNRTKCDAHTNIRLTALCPGLPGHMQLCISLRTMASTPPWMPGTHPQYFGWGGTSTGISLQHYYVLSDIADQYWLPSVRSASSRFHSAIRRHQFASVRQADSRLARLVPPNLQLVLTPLLRADINHTSTPPLSFLQAGCPSCR